MFEFQVWTVKRRRGRHWRYNALVFIEERDTAAWSLKALREAGNSLVAQFSGLRESALCQRSAEDELSLKEIAAHMRDMEELALLQIASLLEEPREPLPAWDVDVLPLERDYRSGDVRVFLAEFRGLRAETTTLLWGASARDWRRPVRHPYRPEVTLETIARELAQHDLEHLWQVRRLKFDLGVSQPSSSDDDWWS
jgi:hypothetical protein